MPWRSLLWPTVRRGSEIWLTTGSRKRAECWTFVTPRDICGPLPTIYSAEEAAKRAWIDPLPHQLKHGGEAGVLETLGGPSTLCPERGKTASQSLEREVSYFNDHRDRLHYQRIQLLGCAIGSGAMESTCSQWQGRFKRTGQFWALPGGRHLLALKLARRELGWERIWPFETQNSAKMRPTLMRFGSRDCRLPSRPDLARTNRLLQQNANRVVDKRENSR